VAGLRAAVSNQPTHGNAPSNTCVASLSPSLHHKPLAPCTTHSACQWDRPPGASHPLTVHPNKQPALHQSLQDTLQGQGCLLSGCCNPTYKESGKVIREATKREGEIEREPQQKECQADASGCNTPCNTPCSPTHTPLANMSLWLGVAQTKLHDVRQM
jgi:hypothetical protein